MFALLGRLPGVVWIAAALFGAAWWVQATHTPPAVVADFLGGKIVVLIGLIVPLLPYAIAFLALLAVIYLIAHHHDGAIRAAISAGALLVVDFIWHFGLDTWAAVHLAGH